MAYELLREKEVAEMLNLPRQTLANWRSMGMGPAYCKMGRTVRYDKKTIIEWIESRMVQPHNAHTAA